MLRRSDSDPTARRVALALGGARVGLGVGALFFTRPALKALLFGESDSAGRAFAKLLGGRDLALGLTTLVAGRDEETLASLTSLTALLDAADAVSMGLAAREPDARPGTIGGALSGAAAALAGLWAARQLGR